jgi:Pyridoxamine 5'-phosphate oxidase
MDTPWEQIPSQRCWELLGTVSVGSLALSVRALPVILPVQYCLTGRRLAVCLGHHAIPERSLDDAVIAFTASAIDFATRSGWSVQIQGRSLIPGRDVSDTTCGQPAAAQRVEIEPGTVSGYYVHPCPFIDTRLPGPQTPG